MMTRTRVSKSMIDKVRRMSSQAICGAMAVAGLASVALPAQATTFNGFNDRFNLGRSAASGAVCEAKRGFEDPLISRGVRVWNVTCRGWSHSLGKLYQFPASKKDVAISAWRTALAATTDCNLTDAPAATPGVTAFKPVGCKTKPAGLDYVAYLPGTRLRAIAAEGMAPISDVLAAGLKFMSGATPEPQAVAEQGADVGRSRPSTSMRSVSPARLYNRQSGDAVKPIPAVRTGNSEMRKPSSQPLPVNRAEDPHRRPDAPKPCTISRSTCRIRDDLPRPTCTSNRLKPLRKRRGPMRRCRDWD